MTRNPSGPASPRGDEAVTRPPRTAAGFALFALLPVAAVLAASFPSMAIAAVAGAALATLFRRLRPARRRADAGPTRLSRETTYDV